MDWQTSDPPLDREIEFETDGRQKRRGQLARCGTFAIGPAPRLSENAARDQYTVKCERPQQFEVIRWREIE